jgi:hypothetical protein
MTCLRRHRGEVEVHTQTIRNPALGDRWPAPRSGRLTRGKITSTYCVVGLGFSLNLMEELGPSGIRSPDHPDRRKSLQRLSSPVAFWMTILSSNCVFCSFHSFFYFRGVNFFLQVTPKRHSLVVHNFITFQIVGYRNGADEVSTILRWDAAFTGM